MIALTVLSMVVSNRASSFLENFFRTNFSVAIFFSGEFGFLDAKPEADKVFCFEVVDDGLDAFMAGRTAVFGYPYFSKRKVKVVVDDPEGWIAFFAAEFQLTQDLYDFTAGIIHKGLGFYQDGQVLAYLDLGRERSVDFHFERFGA